MEIVTLVYLGIMLVLLIGTTIAWFYWLYKMLK